MPSESLLPGPLVTAEWLATSLPAPGLVVLDGTVLAGTDPDGRRIWRSGRARFETAHIPGARFADQTEAFRDASVTYDLGKPSAAAFSLACRELGINDGDDVVVYDTGGATWATRLWWLFREFGHARVAVLDGGLAAWQAIDGAVEDGSGVPLKVGNFAAGPRRGSYVDRAEVAAAIGGSTRLVCALPPADFAGELALRARPGHIPGSINIPASGLLDPERGTFRPIEELREILAPLTDPGVDVVSYCGSGVSATGIAFALDLLGRSDVKVYDGSLSEWAADENLPLEVGAGARP
jgi:thiosulfate/3-mercaptopyruvate sulfurtransferase